MLLLHRILNTILYDCTLSKFHINIVNYLYGCELDILEKLIFQHTVFALNNTHPIYRLSKAGAALVNTISSDI